MRSDWPSAGTLDLLPSGYRTQAEDAGAILLESEPDRDAVDPPNSGASRRGGHARDLRRRRDDRRGPRLPGARVGPLDGPRPLDRDGPPRRDQRRGPRPRDPRRRRRLAEFRPADRRQPAARRLRGAHPGPRTLLSRRRLPAGPLPSRPRPARRLAGRAPGNAGGDHVSWPRPTQSRARPARIPTGSRPFARRSPTAGSTSSAARTPRPKTRFCPSNRPSGSSVSGGEVYREHLEDRNVETFARRRFGLSTQVPQLARRFGFRFAVHFALDGGRFPIRTEPKRLWESPDGSNLESLLRVPMPADRPSRGLMFPWLLATTMRNDHVATVPTGPLAVARGVVVSRPAPGLDPLAGVRPMDDAQRLLPPDRPAL